MMSFLAPKGFRAEVTEGIDLEQGVVLAGARIVIGSGPGDDLCLGGGDIVPGHLTFERRADGRGWDYFTSDRGQSQVDRGNPRTGAVRAGMWFRLGRETRIDIQRAAAPVDATPERGDDAARTVPLPIALGVMGAMAAAALVAVSMLGAGRSSALTLRTAPLVTGAVALEPALAECLAATGTPARVIAATDPANPFWRVMTQRGKNPALASEAQAELVGNIRKILAKAYFLSREDRAMEASQALRRLEYVLPVGTARCPILTASRFDVALLELRGKR